MPFLPTLLPVLCHCILILNHIDVNCLQRRLLQVEGLLDLSHGLVGVLHGVADGPWVRVDLVVVTALKGLVAEEVDGGIGDAAGLLGLVLEVLEAVPLVPARGEDVEGDLATDGEASPRLSAYTP
jgi:hypothetical protein